MLFKHGLDLRLKAWSIHVHQSCFFNAAVCCRNSRKTASAFNSQCPSLHGNSDLKIWTFLRLLQDFQGIFKKMQIWGLSRSYKTKSTAPLQIMSRFGVPLGIALLVEKMPVKTICTAPHGTNLGLWLSEGRYLPHAGDSWDGHRDRCSYFQKTQRTATADRAAATGASWMMGVDRFPLTLGLLKFFVPFSSIFQTSRNSSWFKTCFLAWRR